MHSYSYPYVADFTHTICLIFRLRIISLSKQIDRPQHPVSPKVVSRVIIPLEVLPCSRAIFTMITFYSPAWESVSMKWVLVRMNTLMGNISWLAHSSPWLCYSITGTRSSKTYFSMTVPLLVHIDYTSVCLLNNTFSFHHSLLLIGKWLLLQLVDMQMWYQITFYIIFNTALD